MRSVNLPLGESDFCEIRRKDLFYIDKTSLIEELYKYNGTKVFLFTRPRRFGKTLAMSMLSSFFDITKDSCEIFDGLSISRNREICDKWMNKFPTVFISFKNVDGLTFNTAYGKIRVILKTLFRSYKYLLDSSNVDDSDKEDFKLVSDGRAEADDLMDSLSLLTRMLYAHYGRKVILLIDEYDVPLAKASEKGYYREMLDIMKAMLNVLKDNDCLDFAVVTGCLRIAKESIFTGLNNLYSNTITSTAFSSYFGFTSEEVERTFVALEVEDKLPLAREWYDGYRFGKSEIYSPWDVISYLNDLQNDNDARPKNYWANTSGNSIIETFIKRGSKSVFNSIDSLLSEECIVKRIDDNITYDYLHSSEDNIWSILLMTGYLTVVDKEEFRFTVPEGYTVLRIPNREIKVIFRDNLSRWVESESSKENLLALNTALWQGDGEIISREMTRILNETLSYDDVWHEYVHHIFFAGIFRGLGYSVDSNREHGMGKPDIVVYDYDRMRVAVFEDKSEKKSLSSALRQIDKKKYIDDLGGFNLVLTYAVKFKDKEAEVMLKDRIER